MPQGLLALVVTAGSIGLIHTLIGPDHYLPFIVMAKARKWSLARTAWITVLCGLGHVGSSVVLGFIGIAAGLAVGQLELFEGHRGDIAAWMLTGFGLVYFVWGVRRAIRNCPHTHGHAHKGDVEHAHEHAHHDAHVHPHVEPAKVNLTPWVLFTIFVFGPCEPLIPLLMFPALTDGGWGLAGVAVVCLVFAMATLAAMLTVVLVSTYAVNFLPTARLERYSHAMAGAAVFLCGVAIHLGL